MCNIEEILDESSLKYTVFRIMGSHCYCGENSDGIEILLFYLWSLLTHIILKIRHVSLLQVIRSFFETEII